MATDDHKIICNFLGSPNSGKSVAAASIFARLKKRHVNAVFVTEFAHQMVVEDRTTALQDQLFIWANQNHRIFAGYQHANIVVTDSPILLGAVYNKQSYHLREVILAEHRKYNNLNILLPLDASFPYSMTGRIHTFEESQAIEEDIKELLATHDIPWVEYHEHIEEDIVDLIISAVE